VAELPYAKNDGKTVSRLALKDVPVDGFWSVSVYNGKGFSRRTRLAPIRSTTT
jgi:hypothetical protein